LLERSASVSLRRGFGRARLTAHPTCPFPQPQVQTSRPTLGKDIALTPSGLPLPFGLHLLFLGKGLLRGRLRRGLSGRSSQARTSWCGSSAHFPGFVHMTPSAWTPSTEALLIHQVSMTSFHPGLEQHTCCACGRLAKQRTLTCIQ
ncbi:hypothetical protein MC885_017424, partial [Smutsia gigantea]